MLRVELEKVALAHPFHLICILQVWLLSFMLAIIVVIIGLMPLH